MIYVDVDVVSLGEHIQAARKAAGFETVASLGRATGIADETLWRYENGRRKPGLDAITRIATACRTTVDDLIHGPTSDEAA